MTAEYWCWHPRWNRLASSTRSAIVKIALYCTVFELFDVEKYRDLEIWVRGHLRSFKLVPFESLGAFSYSPSIVTMAVSLTVYEIFNVKI